MCAADNQAVTLYEQCSLSVEDISRALSMPVEAVKVTLMNYSTEYRKAMRETQALVKNNNPGSPTLAENIVSDDEFDAIRRGLLRIALNDDLISEGNPTAARTLKFLYNEKMGRNNVKSLGNLKMNINLISQGILQAREAVQKSLIDIESDVVSNH